MNAALLARRRMMNNQNDRTYLYKLGDECIDITGGWVEGDIAVIKDIDSMYVDIINNGAVFAKTVNVIQTKKYIYMKLKRRDVAVNTAYTFGFVLINGNIRLVKWLGEDENLNIIFRATVNEANDIIGVYQRYYRFTPVYEIWTTDNEDDFEDGYIRITV